MAPLDGLEPGYRCLTFLANKLVLMAGQIV